MTISKKTKNCTIIGSAISSMVIILIFINFSPLNDLEERLLDYRFTIRGAVKPPKDIVIAAIDEKSIKELGRWPWSRDKIAKLIDELTELNSKIIFLDTLFSEVEKHDQSLSDSIWDAGNIILPLAFDLSKKNNIETNTLIEASIQDVKNIKQFAENHPVSAKGVLLPLDSFGKGALSLGHINILPEKNGILRQEAMIIEYNGLFYPSVALLTASYYLNLSQREIEINAGLNINLKETMIIPTDESGRSIINYYGPIETFKHISVSDIIFKRANKKEFKDKIVLVGYTALGFSDNVATPFSILPGIEKHASVIASILEKKFIVHAPINSEILLVLLTGALTTFMVRRYKPLNSAIITLLLLSLLFGSSYLLFLHELKWVNITYPSMNIILIFICLTLYKHTAEEVYSKMIRAMFANYSTEKIVKTLIENPEMAKIGGESRVVTVLFSDIVGFTPFSEKHTPHEVVSLLNEYLDAMTEVVFKWDGTLDKFIGDAIVAFWGAPIAQENHAELAVRCALNMIKRLEELKVKWKDEGKHMLDIGIGLNTGKVIVGNIGAEGKKMDYTVIGDPVNLGSRVESLTRKYNANILITEYTLERIEHLVAKGNIGHVSIDNFGQIVANKRDRVTVKGKKESVDIYEIIALEHGLDSKINSRKKK